MSAQGTPHGVSFETWIREVEKENKKQKETGEGKEAFHSFLLNILSKGKRRSVKSVANKFLEYVQGGLKLLLVQKPIGKKF